MRLKPVLMALLWAASPAVAWPGPASTPQFGVFVAPDGQMLDTEWHLPVGQAQALVTLQHGLARRCANLRSLARTLAESGFATLCVNADVAHGAPALARSLADSLADSLTDSLEQDIVRPDGQALPARVISAGHSAGGLFAAHLAAALARRAPERLAGVLLLDPVGTASLGAALQGVRSAGAAPVLALLAPPSRCNARQIARAALESAAATLVDIAEGTHVDAEGDDTDRLAVWACGEGTPRAAAVRRVQSCALAFAHAAVAAPGPYRAGEAVLPLNTSVEPPAVTRRSVASAPAVTAILAGC